MHQTLAALIELQSLDNAVDRARHRHDELPAATAVFDDQVAAARGSVEAVTESLQQSQAARRELEKELAGIDQRLSRFEDHKLAVKTNHEYTALLSEIATARSEKDAVEERILQAMLDADALARDRRAAEAALAQATADAAAGKQALDAEQASLEGQIARLEADRAAQASAVDARSLALYEQLRRGRRGVAVAEMVDGHCKACHVRLRPHIDQMIRRNDEIIQCESCQRILYFTPVASNDARGESIAAGS